MTEIRAATKAQAAAWRDDWQGRLRSWYGRSYGTADWAARQIELRLSGHGQAAQKAVCTLSSGSDVVGMLAAAVISQGGQTRAMITDVWVAPAHRRRGHAAAAVRWAEDWARSRGADMMWAVTDPADPAHPGLFAGYPVRGQQMIKELSGPDPLPAGLSGRPMTDAEFTAWRAAAVRGYAANIASSGALPAEAAAVAAAAQFDELLPAGRLTRGHTFLCLLSGAETVATNWIFHHRDPGASWVYGVEVSEQQRGKGYGRAAMTIGEQASLAAGDTHLALNVFGHNAIAIGLYQSMGYRAYDHARSASL